MLIHVEIGRDMNGENLQIIEKGKPMIVEDFYSLVPREVNVNNVFGDNRICDMTTDWSSANNTWDYKHALIDWERYESIMNNDTKLIFAIMENR